MKPLAILAAVAAFVSAPVGPAAADAFLGRNGLWVYGTDEPGVMKVVAETASAGPQFFCAAGGYARGPLGARANDRLVLVGPARRDPAFNGRRTVLIALVPNGTPLPRDTGLLVSAYDVGENLSVGTAQFLCNSNRRRGSLFD